MQVVTLSLYRFDGPRLRTWAFLMMGAARLMLPRVVGLEFWKLCGTGVGEGFTPRLFPDEVAVLCAWPSLAAARHRLAHAKPFTAYSRRASAEVTFFLMPTSARGSWAGVEPFRPEEDHSRGPLVALTRATVKPLRSLRFWQRVPDISAGIGRDPNVLFKIGIGEVPLLHQVTFSIWPDTASMAQFARKDGPHAKAIRAVREGNWFREELYARFRVLDIEGQWPGPATTQSFNHLMTGAET